MDKKSVGKLLDAIDVLQEGMDDSIPIQQVKMLLTVALNEGAGVTVLADKAGQKLASGSRNIRTMLKKYNDPHKGEQREGFGLVEERVADNSARQKEITLTRRGAELIEKLTTALKN